MLLDRSYSTLLLDAPAPGILQVTLNRPERANAFTSTMGEEICRCSRRWRPILRHTAAWC
ncbi:hypothetical protein ACFQU2_08525 [Siccirubricoccus deserti]